MPITTIAPWFGGKRTLTPRIVKELGDHRVYWEPFVGGISVILGKPPCAMETINDLHGELINLARVVQHDELAPALFGKLNRTLLSEELHTDAAERWKARRIQPAPDSPDLDRAYDYFLCCWLGRNGVAGTQSYNQGFCARYTAKGGHAAKRFTSAIESIPAWWERLRNVTVMNRDGFELLDKIDDAPRTAIYLDPPYVEKGAKYTYDFDQADHARLAESLRRFKHARIVVSYYDHPAVRELYAGWTLVPCPMTKALVNPSQRDADGVGVVAPEVLLINGMSFTAGGLG